MRRNANYFLMGLFVLGLGLTFVAGILWLGAGTTGRAYQEYLVYMRESVSGLSRDNVVKYQGVDVGRVREIGFDPQHIGEVRLLLQVDQGTPIREDTVATLEAQGLTGLAYINLTGGSAASPLLKPQDGETHPVIPSRPSTWGRLDLAVEELVADTSDVLKLFKKLLGEHNQQRIADTLNNLQTLTGALAERSLSLATAIDDLAFLAQQAREASGELPQLLQQVNDSAAAMRQMAEQIRATARAVDQVVEARDRDLQRFTGEALPEAAITINQLRLTAENLRRFSEQIERDPSLLLRGKQAAQAGPGE